MKKLWNRLFGKLCWEYIVMRVNVKTMSEDDIINVCGKDGWELVSVGVSRVGYTNAYYFKRKYYI